MWSRRLSNLFFPFLNSSITLSPFPVWVSSVISVQDEQVHGPVIAVVLLSPLPNNDCFCS